MHRKIGQKIKFRNEPEFGSRTKRRISRPGHDPRQMDLVATLALLILVAGACWYLTDSYTTQPSKAAFIVPSQSVHW